MAPAMTRLVGPTVLPNKATRPSKPHHVNYVSYRCPLVISQQALMGVLGSVRPMELSISTNYLGSKRRE